LTRVDDQKFFKKRTGLVTLADVSLAYLLWLTVTCSFCPADKPLSKEQLLPEIGAFILAGFDTSSHTIAWCL
jgi:hypothetical protein